MMKIYADNAATTKMSRTALEAMLPYMTEHFESPSSLYTIGQEAKRAWRPRRATVAACIGAQPREITFTSGGSGGRQPGHPLGSCSRREKGKSTSFRPEFEASRGLRYACEAKKEGFE